jgi:hypothetical protein
VDGKVGSRNFFRFAARVQGNLLDPETGFFYAGTYLGTKKVLSLGATVDVQDDYIHWGGDVFADLPVGPGVATAQLNVAHYDGKDFLAPGGVTLAPLPKQTSVMAEAGYLIDAVNLSPIVRFERQSISAPNPTAGMDPITVHETRVGGGLAFWPYGHGVNVKAFYQRVIPDADGSHAYHQINVQTQVYVF